MLVFAAAFAAALRPVMPDFGPQASANTTQGLATMRHFYNLLVHISISIDWLRASTFKSQDLSNSV